MKFYDNLQKEVMICLSTYVDAACVFTMVCA